MHHKILCDLRIVVVTSWEMRTILHYTEALGIIRGVS